MTRDTSRVLHHGPMIDRDGNGIDDRTDLHALAVAAMEARGLLHTLPAPDPIPSITHDDARDLTHLAWNSIDNASSRDLDQVEYAERHDGFTRVYVGIAEVSAYTPRDGAVDLAAAHNGATVYTAAGVFPMIPRALSEDRTSLLDGVARRAMVAALDVSDDGVVQRSEHFPAWVINRCRMDYPTVSAWLDGADPPAALDRDPEMQAQVRLQERVALALRRRRAGDGALTLTTPEEEFVHDAEGNVIDVVTRPPLRASKIVEDLMIAVNEAVARHLSAQGYPSILRVVRAPARWPRIVALAAQWGCALPPHPSTTALARFVDDTTQAHPERAEELSLGVLKLVGRGEYIAHRAGDESPGHFGLAVRDYAHSTAPNRRYPDVIIQRLLHAAWRGHASPYSLDDLTRIADRCVEAGSLARKVERQVAKSAAALFLAGRVGERFDAVVTGVTDGGTFVRLLHPAVEGRVVAGEDGLDVGERVSVRLDRCDVAKGHLDFATVR